MTQSLEKRYPSAAERMHHERVRRVIDSQPDDHRDRHRRENGCDDADDDRVQWPGW